MIRRWFIVGTLLLVMMSLLWNFYREVVAYNPLADLREEGGSNVEEQMEPAPYESTWSEQIVSKNLFSKLRGRTPPPPRRAVVKEPPAPPPEPPDLKLTGVVLNQLGEYIAYIKATGGPLGTVKEGDMFAGALVVDIEERAVTLLWNEQVINLSLEIEKPKSGPPGGRRFESGRTNRNLRR
jgi:hypothetical protein